MGVGDNRIGKELKAADLEKHFKLALKTYGPDHLDLMLVKGYLERLLKNSRVVRYLSRHHPGPLAEFEKIVEPEEAVLG